ncbi:4130_t:CDS:2 [Paraglomus brasilianum]|uniref:4130_t:CDS:1 n=1 Tax=Paraglomus brasilianum TaxID=144538 RepID=A0A9N9AJT5_9GLOM|nr:4130_t:CDS:2 [Paraglomus brasilianum]
MTFLLGIHRRLTDWLRNSDSERETKKSLFKAVIQELNNSSISEDVVVMGGSSDISPHDHRECHKASRNNITPTDKFYKASPLSNPHQRAEAVSVAI